MLMDLLHGFNVPAQDSDNALFSPSATMTTHHPSDRDRLVYELIMRQQPKQARMCGVGGKADRRPIDPPPIVQLRVIDPAHNERERRRRESVNGSPPGSPTPSSSSRQQEDADNSYAQSFLQNPYYFMFASLAKPDDDTELHWLKDGRTRCTTGSVVSSLYHLKDPQNNNEDAGFFVFPDLSVRTEGSYRLKLSLFEVVGNNVRHCKSIFSAPFYVYTAKKFPGMEESTPLSCSLADQGIKIRIRKDIRVRKRPNMGQDLMPLPNDDDDDDEHAPSTRQLKRSRTDDGLTPVGPNALAPVPTTPQQPQQPWPPATSSDPTLGPPIPPPPGATTSADLTTSAGTPQPGTMNLGGPMVMTQFDNRGGYPVYDQQQQQQQPPVPQQPQQQYRDPSQGPQHQQGVAPPPPPQQHQPQQPYGAHHQPPHPHLPPHPSMAPPPGHMPPPPPPQGYAPYHQPAWGPPPPQPQPVYDGYYHQHPPPVHQHPHYPPQHPNAYPQPPPAHAPPPPPAPGRYDYSTTMYQQQPPVPHMPAQYGYYEQPPVHHQQMPPPPPPQQPQQAAPQYGVPPGHQQVPQQVPPPPQYGNGAPAPTPGPPAQPAPQAPQNQGTGSPPTIPPPVAQHQQPPPPATPSYDYSNYRPATDSPQPRQYAPHPQPQPQPPANYGQYAPPPPHMQRPNPYAPPPPAPYPYATYAPPATPGVPTDWNNNGFAQAPTWDAYGQPQPQPLAPPPPQHQPHPQQQPQQQQAVQPPVVPVQQPVPPPSSSSSSSLIGATGDRIQLAPLRAGSSGSSSGQAVVVNGGANGNAGIPMTSSPTQQPTNGQQAQQNGYGMMQQQQHVRSNSRDEYGGRERERSDERSGNGARDLSTGRGDSDSRKKNPLSIGSIISDDVSR